MKIEIVVPEPPETPVGGSFYNERIIAGLRDAGHEVAVVSLGKIRPQAEEATRAAGREAIERATSSGSRLLIDGLSLPAFVGLGDALDAAGAFGLVHHPVSLADGVSEADRPAIRNAALRLLPRLHRVIVTSSIVAERLASEFGIDPARIVTIIPGTDDAPRSPGSGGPGCAILSVGALIPRKGHDVLLHALARLFDLDWHLTIVGSSTRDPAHAAALAALAAELGVAAQVRFTGALDTAALDSLWRETDLFALATRWEAYGAAIAEALRRGVPVAITSGGGAAALVPPAAGVIVEPGDVVQLSKAIRRLIFGGGLRAEMAEAAWQAGRALPDWPTQLRAFATALGS